MSDAPDQRLLDDLLAEQHHPGQPLLRALDPRG
jgi:hypothetical protein